MRKINWLIISAALGLGMVIGIVGFTAANSPVVGTTLLTTFGMNKGNQAVNGVQPANPPTAVNSENATNTDASKQTPNGNANPLLPASASGEGTAAGESDSTTQEQTSGLTQPSNLSSELTQKITSDYKQDIGYFFGAWQCTDMVKFREQCAKAYVGDLYEKHARQAEPFITQGVGLEVRDIRFDNIQVESATPNAATLEATYRYVAQDYNLGEQVPEGETTEHLVHVRVNLIQTNSRWLISGETAL